MVCCVERVGLNPFTTVNERFDLLARTMRRIGLLRSGGGSARERDRRAIQTGVVGLAVQVVNHGIRLVVIPLSIAMLGVEQYGLFLVVGSLVAWGGVTDLGLAPGLINVVATAQGRGDREGMRRAISTAFAAYGVLAVVVALLAVGVSRWDGLPGLLGARTPELAESGRVLVLVCGLILAASTVTRVVTTTTQALQEGYWGGYAHLAASLTGLGLLFALAQSGGGLLSYALAVSIPPLVVQLGLAGYVFGIRHRGLRPGPAWVDRDSLRTLWGFAGPLTVYQLANLAILYTANILIASRLGAGAVPGYSVPYAAFALLIALSWIVVSPYMPAYAEAAARGDCGWVQRRSRQFVGMSAGLAAAGGLVLVALGPWAIDWWTRGAVEVERELLWGLLFFTIVRVVSNTNNVYLMGVGRVRLVAATFVVAAVVFVFGAWWLLPVMGLAAVPVACGVGHLWNVWAGWTQQSR